ncbi:MAG: ATP-binding protein, partial [Gammaproteobacteria bacterium]|nr:ATP-binding protein [Gammaproteobacteria bacterium]
MSTYRIFLSSPGDVLPERNRAQAVVQRLNAEHTGEVPFSLTRWEEAFYSASAPFQGQIASAAEHDLVIFIFWKRLGTELPPGFNRPDGTTRTGTEYEFEEAREARNRREDQLPDILVYRKTAKVFFSEEKLDLERAQKKALDQFWQRWFRTSAGHFVAGFQSFGDAEDFERQLERNLRQWLHHRRELKVAWDTLQRGSPYRGLAAFGEDYSTVFFGRDADTARARAKLIEARVGADGASGTPFLLILGHSGSGKSSLLRAGLVPRLRQSGAPGTKEDGSDCIHAFRVLELVPHEMGVDLCAAFAERLCGDESSAPLVLPELRKGDLSDPWQLARLAHTAPDIVAATVVRALDRIEHPRGARSMPTGSTGRVGLLLVIDQLEELFSIPLSIRQPFTHLLRGLAATGRVWIVATMRNDFYDALRSDPELSALADAGRLYDLARPTQADYRTIIRAPAAAAGLVFEVAAGRDLAQEIEDEAQNEGALPVVSFLLEQLFQERRGNVLTLDTYDRLGGAAGALARHGEEVVAHLEAGPRDAIPNVVRRLVRKGL